MIKYVLIYKKIIELLFWSMIALYVRVTARSLNDWSDVFNTYKNIIGHQDLAVTVLGSLLIVWW